MRYFKSKGGTDIDDISLHTLHFADQILIVEDENDVDFQEYMHCLKVNLTKVYGGKWRRNKFNNRLRGNRSPQRIFKGDDIQKDTYQ